MQTPALPWFRSRQIAPSIGVPVKDFLARTTTAPRVLCLPSCPVLLLSCVACEPRATPLSFSQLRFFRVWGCAASGSNVSSHCPGELIASRVLCLLFPLFPPLVREELPTRLLAALCPSFICLLLSSKSVFSGGRRGFWGDRFSISGAPERLAVCSLLWVSMRLKAYVPFLPRFPYGKTLRTSCLLSAHLFLLPGREGLRVPVSAVSQPGVSFHLLFWLSVSVRKASPEVLDRPPDTD